MRNLIYAINITADGCCDHTAGIANDEVHEYFAAMTRDVDVLVYGRKTYELMVPYWPDVAKNHSGETKAINTFADAFVSVNRIVVFSKSLEAAEGTNTTIFRTNLQDEILKLKQEQGKSLLVGGVALPTQLIELGLVDEFNFVVHPIVVGQGRRLLDGRNLQHALQLKLVDTNTFKSGHVALRYVKH